MCFVKCSGMVIVGLLCCGLALASPVQVQPVTTQQAEVLSGSLVAESAGSSAANATDRWSTDNAVMLRQGPAAQGWGELEQWSRTFDRSGYREFVASPLGSNYAAHRMSLTDSWRNPLDTPPCSLVAALDTGMISYYAGILPGDGYKIWVDPADCGGCATVYPYGIDSIRFSLVQDDGSPRDTVTIGIDIECARLTPNDPCNGPGTERCFAIWNIALPLDTLNGFLSIYDVTLPLDSCRVDGPFFVGLFHLGHTVTDPSIFHPSVAFKDSLPPAVACEEWTNLSGAWDSWANTWQDPDPGIPMLTVYGECDDTGPGIITPCPLECGDQRISGPLAYYVSGTTAIWDYFVLSPEDFPYHPTQIDFDFYYDTTGTTNDTTDVLITYGCPNNGNICCVPSDIICAGIASIVRANGGDNQLQAVSLDLDPMTCCLNENFFVGIIITRHTGTALNIPKFLSSNRATEIANNNDIIPCQQWGYSGSYVPFPSGSQIGWFDLSITGSCGSCPTAPTACTTQSINCANATPLACGPNQQVLANQTTIGGSSTVSQYCCAPWDESGPEKVYSIAVPQNGSIAAAVSNTGGQDLDIFVLSACDPENSVACSDSAVNLSGLTAGTYYIVVDGFDGAQGSFTLTFTIPCTGATGCPTAQCGTGLNGGGTILVWDGELLPNGNVAYLCQGTTVGGNDMVVKILNPSCALVSTVDIGGNSTTTVARGLAYDDRDGSWWTHTFVAPKKLRHYSAAGTLLAEFDSLYFAPNHVASYSVSGLAFDADNNHLWAIQSSLGRYIEFDVTNAATPAWRQTGTMPIHAGAGYSAAGLDYDECNDRLLVSTFRGSPLTRGEVECWQDNNPAGIGGVTLLTSCTVMAGGITQNWGLARSLIPNQLNLPNLDATANTDHRVWTTSPPCAGVPPIAPTQATIIRTGNDITVRWTAPAAGRYIVYKTNVKNNDGNPNGGSDPDFTVEASVMVAAAGMASYTDVGAFAPDPYLNYVIVAACP